MWLTLPGVYILVFVSVRIIDVACEIMGHSRAMRDMSNEDFPENEVSNLESVYLGTEFNSKYKHFNHRPPFPLRFIHILGSQYSNTMLIG